MRRWIFNVASLVSLLLWVGMVTLWARSFVWSDAIEWSHPSALAAEQYKFITVVSVPGGLCVNVDDPTATANAVRPPEWSFGAHRQTKGLSNCWWFHGSTERDKDGVGYFTTALIPDWPLIVGLLILPSLFARKWFRQSRRISELLCPTCGYDLRATPERCPECGTGVALRTTSAH